MFSINIVGVLNSSGHPTLDENGSPATAVALTDFMAAANDTAAVSHTPCPPQPRPGYAYPEIAIVLFQDEDTIKAKAPFTRYYADLNIWGGGLRSFDPYMMYQWKSQKHVEINLVGTLINLATYAIQMRNGWTYLPCPFHTRSAVPHFCKTGCNLPDVTYVASDQLKNREGFIRYYEAHGWYNPQDAFAFEPGKGYFLWHSGSQTGATRFGVPSSRRQLEEIKEAQLLAQNNRDALRAVHKTWGLQQERYESSMTLTAAVFAGDIVQQSGTLLAFLDAEVRGAAHASSSAAQFGPMKGKHVFEMLIYISGHDSGKAISFHFARDGLAAPLSGSIIAALDASHGDLIEPVSLRVSSSVALERLLDKCMDLMEPGQCAAKQAMGMCDINNETILRDCRATCGIC